MAEITPPEKSDSPSPATPAQANVGTLPTTSKTSSAIKKYWPYALGVVLVAAIAFVLLHK